MLIQPVPSTGLRAPPSGSSGALAAVTAASAGAAVKLHRIPPSASRGMSVLGECFDPSPHPTHRLLFLATFPSVLTRLAAFDVFQRIVNIAIDETLGGQHGAAMGIVVQGPHLPRRPAATPAADGLQLPRCTGATTTNGAITLARCF